MCSCRNFAKSSLFCGSYFWRNVSKCLLTLDRELITDQNSDIINVQLCETMCFNGTTCRNKCCLQEQKLFKNSCISEGNPIIGNMESWKPGAHCVTCSSSIVWKVSFPGGSIFVSLFQVIQPIFVSYKQLAYLSFSLSTWPVIFFSQAAWLISVSSRMLV